jgi:hypothetical protein
VNDPASHYRLEGLEPDNLLAFLALLGLLRALEASRAKWFPRAAWDLDQPPVRPILTIAEPASRGLVCEAAAKGVATLLAAMDFASASDLKLNKSAARSLCCTASERSAADSRYFSDLCGALISDAATDPDGTGVEPTPLAYPTVATSKFLKNFLELAQRELPDKRRRDPSYPKTAADCIAQALFSPWTRLDRPVGLRWDPDEAKRHAYLWRAPTKDAPTTQHGANRLAIVGIASLTGAPVVTGNRVRLSVLGGAGSGDQFSLAWPIWTTPASLASIRALLSHPSLREPGALAYLGVDHVRAADASASIGSETSRTLNLWEQGEASGPH